MEYVERFEFYERAKKCYAVIATGSSWVDHVMGRETSQYANIFPRGSVSLALWNLSWLLIGIDFNSSNLVPARVYCSLFVIPFKE